jgi:hypothetical protein
MVDPLLRQSPRPITRVNGFANFRQS